MLLFPPTGLGRVLVATIAISLLALLVLNLASFGGLAWITYVDRPVQFGLWRVCNTTRTGGCQQWTGNNIIISNITNGTFASGKPSYVRAAQALEIISLIFYAVAALLIAVGLLDIDGIPFRILFLAAAALLFICIIFLAASLGVMGNKGRRNHPGANLDWAWWCGLVGLIMTTVCFLALIATVFITLPPAHHHPGHFHPNLTRYSLKGAPQSPPIIHGSGSVMPMMIAGGGAPIFPHHQSHDQWAQGHHYDPYGQQHNPHGQQYDPHGHNYGHHVYHAPHTHYGQSSHPSDHQNAMMASYGGANAVYEHPSPMISALAQQYVHNAVDTQREHELLSPYHQYTHPHITNSYL